MLFPTPLLAYWADLPPVKPETMILPRLKSTEQSADETRQELPISMKLAKGVLQPESDGA